VKLKGSCEIFSLYKIRNQHEQNLNIGKPNLLRLKSFLIDNGMVSHQVRLDSERLPGLPWVYRRKPQHFFHPITIMPGRP